MSILAKLQTPQPAAQPAILQPSPPPPAKLTLPTIPAEVCQCGSNLFWQSIYGVHCSSCKPTDKSWRRDLIVMMDPLGGFIWKDQATADRESQAAYNASLALKKKTSPAALQSEPLPLPPAGATFYVQLNNGRIEEAKLAKNGRFAENVKYVTFTGASRWWPV